MAAGHKVTVITCVPNFPEGKVYPGYLNKFYQKEELDGIEVRRVKTYITANEGFTKRALDYISFMFAAIFAGLFVRKPDVVIATSPQLFCACAGWFLSFIKRRPFVFELRDIWPASIKAVGASDNQRLIRAFEKVEMFLYRRAALIVSVTNSFKKELTNRGVDPAKIVVVLNGVDLDVYKPLIGDNELKNSLNLENKFVLGYIGTIALAHAVETIVEAAELLKGRNDIAFIIVGGGANSENIARLAAAKNLPNLLVMGRQHKNKMPTIWGLCDASVVHLKDTPLFSKVIPSKIFESFAMGIPVLIGILQGEATQLVLDCHAGVAIYPENAERMAGAVIKMKEDTAEYRKLRNDCLDAARQFNRKQLALQMLAELEKVAIA